MNAPDWVTSLPLINALLNGLATILLVAGYWLVKRKRHSAHIKIMLCAFGVSVIFLICYLTYHFALHHYTGSSSRKFPSDNSWRPIYLSILLTHIVLAAAVPVLAVVTIYRGWQKQWEKHRRIARITFPIWLYVSITGVIIYLMLYHLV